MYIALRGRRNPRNAMYIITWIALRGLRYVDCGDAVLYIALAQTERFYATPLK